MTPGTANPYLRTKILTASPQELRLMLYEGAIRFCRRAREHLPHKQYEDSYNALMRAQKIVLELSTSLNHNVAPDLCQKLSALYTYIYRLLVDANIHHNIKPLDEAISLLEYEKETWELLMKKVAADNQAGTAPQALTSAQQTAISSLSLNG
ncbi:MAG: flagellar export chaperone FliS [Phycisphaeraceae bacterium]|nr:flagellar export chaperone FliS [Phycisphaeraceae bacterium]